MHLSLCPTGINQPDFFSHFFSKNFSNFPFLCIEGLWKETPPPLRMRKEVNSMSDEDRIQFLLRCQFNAYCKKAIANRAAELKRNSSRRWTSELYFENLSPAEQESIQVIDEVIDDGIRYYYVAGRTISSDLLLKAIESLPDNKQTVINLYFFDEMTEMEIAELLKIPRASVGYRKDSSLKKIKQYLEEHKNDDE